jgi:hypothetical protein
MTIVMNILKSKWFWIVLGVVVLFLLVRGPLKRTLAGLTNLLQKDGGDYSTGLTDGAGSEVSGAAADARKKEIEAMTQEVYNQLTAGVPSPTAREASLVELSKLNDSELRIAAKHYKLLSRDKSLFQAVDDAWMPFSDVDEELMGRLSNIAMT